MTPTSSGNRGWGKIVILIAVFISAAGFSKDRSDELYRAKETSFDLFGSYLAQEYGFSDVFKTNIRGGWMGGGVGMNKFFSAKLGIGADINIPNNGGQFIDNYTMNLIGRLPLGKSGLAPYLFGGGGRTYDPSIQWIEQVGIGLEYRSEHAVGVFVDGRYVWGETRETDRLLLRAGLRLVF